jgi:type I restriction enzyme S subunit
MAAMTTKQTSKQGATPRLRFPKFRDAPAWEKTALGQLGELVSGLTYRPEDTRDEGLLVLRSSNIRDGTIVLEDNVYVRPDISGANLSMPNDILICVRNGSKALIGKNALIPEHMPLCTHGAFMTVFRSRSAKFIFQLFQTDAYERQVSADLGATINSINGAQLKKYEFYIPGPDEQQKIVACLSSLDELIAAQGQTLDALNAHKQGLLQQLFPAEGETVPQLRFPEFQDAGVWEVKRLGDIATISSGTTPSRSDSQYYEGGSIPWVKTTDLNNSFIYFTEECITSYARARINPEDSILVAMYGGFNQIGRTGYLKVPAATNQAISVLNASKDMVVPLYLLVWLNAKVGTWRRFAGSSRKDPNITGADVANFPISFPSITEQQKIADSISSLDELIDAQTKKLDALKTHKQGLLQQLFPAPEEVRE